MKPKDLADFGNMLYCSPKETMSHTCGPPGDQATTSSFRALHPTNDQFFCGVIQPLTTCSQTNDGRTNYSHSQFHLEEVEVVESHLKKYIQSLPEAADPQGFIILFRLRRELIRRCVERHAIHR